MDTHHNHNHHHHHHEISASMSKIFIFCIALNLLFVGIEAIVGLLYNSVGLLSDAGHNLSDVFSLVLVLVAFRMSKAASTPQFTYGYKKATILISLINALILLVAVGAIIIESIYKLKNPQPIRKQAGHKRKRRIPSHAYGYTCISRCCSIGNYNKLHGMGMDRPDNRYRIGNNNHVLHLQSAQRESAYDA